MVMLSSITATPIITHSAINHFTIGAEMSLQAKDTYVTERQANDVQGGHENDVSRDERHAAAAGTPTIDQFTAAVAAAAGADGTVPPYHCKAPIIITTTTTTTAAAAAAASWQ